MVTESDVYHNLDSFFRESLEKYKANISRFGLVKVGIICGKGINSKRKINGKNPLRVYTERYLKRLGFQWRNGKRSEGEEGVIVVDLQD